MSQALRAASRAGAEAIVSLSKMRGAILSDLDAAIEQAGGVRAYAKTIGISPSFVSAVRRQKKAPAGKLLDDLGYEAVRFTFYRRKEPPHEQ